MDGQSMVRVFLKIETIRKKEQIIIETIRSKEYT